MLINSKTGCICGGHVAREPEVKQVCDTTVTKFSVAYGKSETELAENGKPKSLYMNVDCWGALGETAQLLSKADSCLIWGAIQSREYNGKTYHTLRADGITFGADVLLKCVSALGNINTQPGTKTPPQAYTDPNAAIAQTFSPGSFEPIGEDEDLPF